MNSKINSRNANNSDKTPLYIGETGKELFAWYHTPKTEQQFDSVIVICPPIGLDYMNSYRTLRYTADYLASAGFPVLRFDYINNGSSNTTEQSSTFIEPYLKNIKTAHKEAQNLSGCKNVIYLGFRIGALFASLAAEQSKPDSVIFWGGIYSGKKYLRELKALEMTRSTSDANAKGYQIDVAGLLLTDEDINEINKINLTDNKTGFRNLLLIHRDDFKTDKKQYKHWQENSVNMTEITTSGFSDIITDAHNTIVPHSTICEVVDKITQISDRPFGVIKKPKHQNINNRISLKINTNTTITEKPINFGPSLSNIGIITEPEHISDSLPIVIISNSGANHHSGPHKLYTEIARKLATIGFVCLRYDIQGIGDSLVYNEVENDVYPEESESQVIACQKYLSQNYDAKKFLLMGLCSGAYISFNASQKANKYRIEESILINPLTFHWEKGMTLEDSPVQSYEAWGWYKKAITNSDSWKKLITGNIEYSTLIIALKNRIIDIYKSSLLNLFHNNKDVDDNSTKLPSKLNYICNEKNTKLTFLFAEHDPGYDILMLNAGRVTKKLIKLGKIKIHTIKNADHTFSRCNARKSAIEKIISHIKDSYID